MVAPLALIELILSVVSKLLRPSVQGVGEVVELREIDIGDVPKFTHGVVLLNQLHADAV